MVAPLWEVMGPVGVGPSQKKWVVGGHPEGQSPGPTVLRDLPNMSKPPQALAATAMGRSHLYFPSVMDRAPLSERVTPPLQSFLSLVEETRVAHVLLDRAGELPRCSCALLRQALRRRWKGALTLSVPYAFAT